MQINLITEEDVAAGDVKPAYRKQGIAKAMLADMERYFLGFAIKSSA